MDHVRIDLPQLRGGVHAAGLLDDATIMNLTPEQLDRVLGPKVDGARNLDEATADDPLDMFVMFSSAAALFGTVGQAAYAAGNAFMDTLATARRRRGRPALSVQWGPFSDIGLAAQDSNRGARLAAHGMSGLTTQEAWQALTRFLAADEQVVGYVSMSLRQWFDAYPDVAAQKSWRILRDAALETSPGGGHCAAPDGAGVDVRPEMVEVKVRELVGRVLRLDPQAIEREAPFKALGLDSMLSLELRNRLEAAFGLTLPSSLVWTHGNSRTLADELCSRLSG
jgi:phthiocerol/phenolphthiocerol synthesis type-I polyketide synthase C